MVLMKSPSSDAVHQVCSKHLITISKKFNTCSDASSNQQFGTIYDRFKLAIAIKSEKMCNGSFPLKLVHFLINNEVYNMMTTVARKQVPTLKNIPRSKT